MKLRFSSLAFGAVLLSAPVLSAQTLVSWGPSAGYVTANQSGQRAAGGGVIPFDLDTPISPLSDDNYTGGTFYGGVDGAPSLNTGFAVFNNRDYNEGNDALVFGRATGVEPGYKVSGVFLWKQEDFLVGPDGATDSVTVTSLSYAGLSLSGTATASEARFVLQQGSSYLISDNVVLNNGFLATHSLTDLSSVNWHSYDPGVSITAIGPQVSSPSFDGVTALGIYLTTTATDTDALNLVLAAFSASGVVSAIPEPSTVALLAGLGGLAIVVMRRRR
ncbi:hypothetical protein OPIT5_20355 [Opitutaceae bacterium TAV5]|nr:hypothetical protein OPIT5_20355 [Opitutaceae bacterium TAV5]